MHFNYTKNSTFKKVSLRTVEKERTKRNILRFFFINFCCWFVFQILKNIQQKKNAHFAGGDKKGKHEWIFAFYWLILLFLCFVRNICDFVRFLCHQKLEFFISLFFFFFLFSVRFQLVIDYIRIDFRWVLNQNIQTKIALINVHLWKP